MRLLAALAVGAACSAPAAPAPTAHSSSIAVSGDGAALYVVNPDADSISILDPRRRTLVAEVLLGGTRPAPDPVTGAFTPAVMPRALALAPDGATLYVTGQRAGAVFAVDLASRRVRSVAVGSEPVGIVVSPDGAAVFVACSQEGTVSRIAAASLTVTATVSVARTPWALGWSPGDGALVVTHLLDPSVTALDPATLAVRATWKIPKVSTRGDPRLAHGKIRGAYDVAARPGTAELWIPHLLLGTDTPQPRLDFETTVFPAVSIVHAGRGHHATLSIDAQEVAGIDGAFGDVVSGPHALAFTADGALALVVDTASEDVLVIDAARDVEAALLRPLPGHTPEGIVLAPDERVAYVDERGTGDVAVVRIDRSGGRVALAVDGPPIRRWRADPMPATLRLGHRLFYSANSDEVPITRNHWVACASCHIEGATDAVTWRFTQGPRDTPSNAGGTRETGLLFRTADRSRVQDYWHTINVEQGGRFDPEEHRDLLDALAAYVDHGIPLPVPPVTDLMKVAAGRAIFERPDVGCASCHRGAWLTDSVPHGAPVLHDVGTCVVGGEFPDAAHADVLGPRAACAFDTPSLRGLAATAPYLHDGTAPTLQAVLERTRGKMGDISSLSASEQAALVEYLRSL